MSQVSSLGERFYFDPAAANVGQEVAELRGLIFFWLIWNDGILECWIIVHLFLFVFVFFRVLENGVME